MPFKTIADAKEGNFPTVINDIQLTIGQVNTLSRMFDTIKERGGVDEPMAVAISTFKKSHKVVDGKFVTKQDMSDEYINECIDIEFADKELFSVEKEIFMIGEHTDCRGNKRKFTENDLDAIISAFEKGVRSRNGVPLKLGHSEDQPLLEKAELPNAGIVSKLRKQGGKLIALIENVPKMIKEFIENKHFKTVSAGLLANFTDTVLKEKFSLVLDHVALLGQTPPAIKGLKEFDAFFVENVYMFSEENGKMVNVKIEKDDLNANDDSQKVAIPSEEDQIKQKEKDMSEERIKELEAQLKAAEAEKAQLNDKLGASEKEKAEYSENLKKIEADKVEAANKAKEIEVNNFVEQMKKDGKVTLALEPMVRDRINAIENFEEAKKEIEALPVIVDFSEKGLSDKKDEEMEENYKEEKEKMETNLKFSSGEEIELTHFDLHKKIEKAVKDKEYANYEEALIALSPVK
jgi:hypothetical protein